MQHGQGGNEYNACECITQGPHEHKTIPLQIPFGLTNGKQWDTNAVQMINNAESRDQSIPPPD